MRNIPNNFINDSYIYFSILPVPYINFIINYLMNISRSEESFEVDKCYCNLFSGFRRAKALNAKYVVSENFNPDSHENSFWGKPKISLR